MVASVIMLFSRKLMSVLYPYMCVFLYKKDMSNLIPSLSVPVSHPRYLAVLRYITKAVAMATMESSSGSLKKQFSALQEQQQRKLAKLKQRKEIQQQTKEAEAAKMLSSQAFGVDDDLSLKVLLSYTVLQKRRLY